MTPLILFSSFFGSLFSYWRIVEVVVRKGNTQIVHDQSPLALTKSYLIKPFSVVQFDVINK